MKINVIEYLEKTKQQFPDKLAVIDNTERITFRVLYDIACRTARQIKSYNIFRSPICVFIPKGCKAIEAFAGINMSGNFYVPLDTKSPHARVRSIIDVLNPALIITDSVHIEDLRQLAGDKQILIIDAVDQTKGDDYSDCIFPAQIDTDPVYAIFTSGSTGTPKGVVISHRGVIDYIDWAVETFNIDSTSVIGNQAPFYFDNSTLDIYLMYATGATLNIIPEADFMFPSRLIDYMNDNRITFIFWVPFALINVANFKILDSKKPEYLKDVLFAGEVMPNKHLNYWRRCLPDCRYANLYGPTEITVDCTYYIVDREFSDDEPLPIGYPCRNSDVMIITESGEIAGNGEVGELCVRGSSLSMGYYNDPEKTAKAFVQNPFNNHYPELIYRTGDMVYKNERGEIMYVGRRDSQIKHNGYRIELGEIENAANGSGVVENSCAVYDFRNKRIVLFYQSGKDLNLADFRKKLLAHIPKYMIPAVFNRIEEMKTNQNGKIDRLYYNNLANETN